MFTMKDLLAIYSAENESIVYMNENWQKFFDIGDSFNKQMLLK